MKSTEQSQVFDENGECKLTRIEYQYSEALPEILRHLNSSILISTYQTGKLICLGTNDGQVTVSFMSYDQPMGVATNGNQIAVGARNQIEFLAAHHAAASTVPQSTEGAAIAFDGCFVPRRTHYTGPIMVHDLGWGHEGLWVTNTLFSCLCTIDDSNSFVPRWKPSFISRLASEDRCHLNGMAIHEGRPAFVTALAQTDTVAGWRQNKTSTGCIIDVSSDEVIADGLCMPHSPRVYKERLWVLNSGLGDLSTVDQKRGKLVPVETVPGFTRGLAFAGQFAFVGLSQIRETNVFGGLPIGKNLEELCCGVGVVDILTGSCVATFRFLSGIQEVFAIDVVSGHGNLRMAGANQQSKKDFIWVVPGPEVIPIGPATGPATARDFKSPTIVSTELELMQVINLAEEAHEDRRLQDSLELYQKAIQLAPPSATLLCQLGNLYQDLDDRQSAIALYEQASLLNPGHSPTQQNLGVLYSAINQPRRALRHFELAEQANPNPVNLLLASKVLPIIYESSQEVEYWRSRLVQCVDELVSSGTIVDTTDNIVPTSFSIAYQGKNDRDLMQRLSLVHKGVRLCPAARDNNWRIKNTRVRVGFLSAYFCQHTIGNLNIGLIENISREQFEVSVLALQKHDDTISARFRAAADFYVEIPRRVAAARRLIAEMGLDILIFADVGMDCLSQTLSYSRMAPIQAVTWGHPDTTGSPEIDYFISSELAEPMDAENHYSETLISMPTMGIRYEWPSIGLSKRTKESFGLNPRRRVYLCPQTLFKFHPDFDSVLRMILDSDPEGDLVLVEGTNPTWADALRSRWRKTLSTSIQQIRWVPSLPRNDFLQLLSIADVVLDPFPFCGGNTSYEAIAMGTPVVSLPGQFLRGRLTLGIYRRMQMEQLIVKSRDDYAKMAIRIASDFDFSRAIRKEIQVARNILFENDADVRAWEYALNRMILKSAE